MTKTLIEQYRAFPPPSLDPRQFGNGSPMHARMPFDLVQILNNMQTYCDPSMGFVCDISYNMTGVGSSAARTMYTRPTSAYYAAGTALIGQVPILVPLTARRLCYSFGFYRFPATFEGLIQVDVTRLGLYLASRPCGNLLAPVATAVESSRIFSPTYITGPYSSYTNSFVPAGAVDGSTNYARLEDSTWTDYLTPWNVNNRDDNPWSFLIVTLDFSNMAVLETIQGAELSWWFEYQ